MNNLFPTKRGTEDVTLHFLFVCLPVTILAAIAMVILVHTYITTEVNIQQTNAELFIQNVLYEKNGISYYDERIDRVLVGTIPVASFENPSALEERLDQHMDFGEHTLIAAQLTLFDSSGKNLGVAYYNKEWYDRWIVVARTFWKGSGSATEFSENKTVLLLYSDKTTAPGILQFSVVMPNS